MASIQFYIPFACLCSLLFFFLSFLRIRRGPLSKVPGPMIARWTSLWLKLQVLLGQRVHYIHRLHMKYGRCSFVTASTGLTPSQYTFPLTPQGPLVIISPTEISVSDLEATKTIHKIGGGFLKSPWYQSFNASKYPGIFAMTDPHAHAARRRLLAQSFSKSNLLRWEPLIRSRVDLAVSKIQAEGAKTGKADLLKWWTFMATDLIGELSFGDSFRMLEQGKKNAYVEDLETAMMFSGIRSELPGIVATLSYLPISAIRHIQTVGARVAAHGRESIRRHKHMALTGELADKPTFFSKIFAAEKSQALSDMEIEQEASNLIVAGSDTTAVTITYLIWAVLRHPAVYQRLRDELQTLPHSFSSENLQNLPYLNAIIEETLRLYCAAPGSLPRIVPAGGSYLCNFYIPEGTTVSTQAFTLHRDQNIFAEPDDFIPSRWLSATPRMQEAQMPFGAGSRVCIGLHLARLEISLSVATFFRECEDARVSDETSDADMEMENYFLIAPKAHQCFITCGLLE